MPQHGEPYHCLALSPDGRTVATGGWSGIELWDAATGRPTELQAAPKQAPSLDTVIRSLADKTLGREKTVLLEHVDQWTSTQKLESGWNRRSSGSEDAWAYTKYQAIQHLLFTPDGTKLFSAAEGGRINVGGVATCREIEVWRGHTGTVFTIALSPDGQTLASGGEDRTIRLWNKSVRYSITMFAPTARILSDSTRERRDSQGFDS